MPEYLIILISIFILSFSLQKKYKLKLYSSKKHLIFFLVITFTVGFIWDNFALTKGHWSFGTKYLLGAYIGQLPAEELLFFAIFPYSLLVLHKLLEKITNKKPNK